MVQDIEEDPEMQQQINLYRRGEAKTAATTADDDDDGFPGVRLESLLDEMSIR